MGKANSQSSQKLPAGNIESHDLLTVDQAAQYLQVSASSIRGYIRQGRLKAFRIAGLRKVLIPRAKLLALLQPTNCRNDYRQVTPAD